MFGHVAIGLGLLCALYVALELGYAYGRWTARRSEANVVSQIGTVQGALLGLLGLLLGFSFAGAASRFMERQDLIVSEANALGTAHLRAELLDEPQRSELRGELRRYLAYRVSASQQLQRGLSPETHGEIEAQHAAIWRAAKAGVQARPELAVAVLPPVNEVIDLHATRVAAGRKSLPRLVLGLLILSCVAALGTIGYGAGLAGRRNLPIALSFALLVSAALWITIDMDRPRQGLLQLDDSALEQLRLDE